MSNVKHRKSIFSHITRMSCTVPVHQALRCQIDLSLGRFPADRSWKRCHSRLPKRCLEQICDDSLQRLPADVWRLERCYQARSSTSDATVPDNYALTTTMTTGCLFTFVKRTLSFRWFLKYAIKLLFFCAGCLAG